MPKLYAYVRHTFWMFSLKLNAFNTVAVIITNLALSANVPHFKNCLLRLRLSSSRSEQNIGRRVVSIWHDRWQYPSHHSSQYPVSLSVCPAMSSLVVRPSSCHRLVSILRLDWLVWLLGVAECDQQIVFFWLSLCRVVPFVQNFRSSHHFVICDVVAPWNSQNAPEATAMENINHLVNFVGRFPRFAGIDPGWNYNGRVQTKFDIILYWAALPDGP